VNYEPSDLSYNIPESISENGDAKNILVRMPKTISTAINNITREIQMLGKDGKNEFQKYNYASIDKFLSTVNPLAGHFGLIITQDEETCKIITDTQGRPWLNIVYRFILSHKDGDTWQYTPRRTIYCEMKGGQAMGAAQSYALKQFMRSLFLIATGENDDLDNQNQTYNNKKEVKKVINKEGKTERRTA
jgi:hypothetical protein